MNSRSLSDIIRTRELVYQIKIGCECFNVLKKRPIIRVHWRSNFKAYVNQDKSLSDLQTLIKHSFLLNFRHELLMIF
jgi:hypothetical protein